MVTDGMDIALKFISQTINSFYNDFKELKNKIKSLKDVSDYFLNFKYKQVNISLNYLIPFVTDRSADSFLVEINELVKKINTTIICLDLLIFIFIYALILVFVIIKNLLDLEDLLLNSTSRIIRSTCYIKTQNISN